MDPNQSAWSHLEQTRESPTIKNRVEHGEREFAAFLQHAKMTRMEFENLSSWEQVSVLRRCDAWLTSGADI